MLDHPEPFKSLLTQGMVNGRAYRTMAGEYLKPEDVGKDESGRPIDKRSGETIETVWEKMSKSKFNGVEPSEMLDKYGSEATRLCIISNAAPKSDRHWNEDVFDGVDNWMRRTYQTVGLYRHRMVKHGPAIGQSDDNMDLFEQRNWIVAGVTYYINSDFLLNTAITRLHMLTSILLKAETEAAEAKSCRYIDPRAIHDLVIMMSPMAPLFCSELWSGLQDAATVPGHAPGAPYDMTRSVLEQSWPTVDQHWHAKIIVQSHLGDELTAWREPVGLMNATPSETMARRARDELDSIGIGGEQRAQTSFSQDNFQHVRQIVDVHLQRDFRTLIKVDLGEEYVRPKKVKRKQTMTG